MSSNDNDLEVTDRKRRGLRPSSGPASDGSPGMMKVLWADLRKRPVPSEMSTEELEWLEEEEAARRETEAVLERAHTVGDDKVNQWRMRYGTN